MTQAPVSRRAVLLIGVSVGAVGISTLLAGCDADPLAPRTPAPAAVEPLTPLLIAQQALVARYAETLSMFPELAPRLTDLQAQASAHTDALHAALPAAAAQARASDAVSGSSSPADATAALAELRQAVDRAAGALRSAALRADGDLAALLGSCAASTACHLRVLG